ncbi:hypothetical protein [Pseudonocardia sp. H11422]|uniref:hypothetical protein n=1 Tax=Pseudonocardia sp. H11422 TaxID=2835866 RepID=UPI00292E861F|nr:hypothetical protein [Pseudonocardia sp. H11422]
MSRLWLEPESPPAGSATDSGLAARQAELVAALVAGGPLPAGFDAGRVAVARRALLRKPAGEAARVWPLLAASLGPAWPGTFAAHADGHPPAGALRDGWDLARALRAGGEPGDGGAAELAEREVGRRYDGVRPPASAARGPPGALGAVRAGRGPHTAVGRAARLTRPRTGDLRPPAGKASSTPQHLTPDGRGGNS